MRVSIAKSKLTDGSEVWDVSIYANGGTYAPSARSMFSCTSEEAATAFYDGLCDLASQYTVEDITEI